MGAQIHQLCVSLHGNLFDGTFVCLLVFVRVQRPFLNQQSELRHPKSSKREMFKRSKHYNADKQHFHTHVNMIQTPNVIDDRFIKSKTLKRIIQWQI